MQTKKVPFTFNRGGYYYFTRRIPKDLKHHYKCKRIVQGLRTNWQWHLDEVFIKINGERFHLWRAVDHEREVLECFVTKRRNKAAAKKFLNSQIIPLGYPRFAG
jgi:transposase-like protein